MSSILKVDTIQDASGNAIISSDGSGNLTPNTFTGLTISGNLSVDGGTIKLDGNYPTGSNNVALGNTALDSVQTGGDENTAIGSNALTANTTGDQNTGIGRVALSSNTTGGDNTAVGTGALRDNTTASNNTAVGSDALKLNTASNNTAVGYQALDANTTGASNVAMGYRSMLLNTTGFNNVAVGVLALESNTTGDSNVAMGREALEANTTAANNTAVGYQALTANTTGGSNTSVGFQSLKVNSTGTDNTAIGRDALEEATGASNTALGKGAGSLITTGAKNTILGRYNGNQDGLDIRTSSNNVVLSDGDGNVGLAIQAQGCVTIGDQKTPFSTSATLNIDQLGDGFPILCHREGTADGVQISFHNDNGQVGRINTNGSSTSYVTSSDYRLKENVVEMTGATDRLKQLSPKRFNFIADADTTVDGFLAHEVSDIVPEAITGTKDEVDADGNPVYQGIDQSKLVPLLVATIKELEARITALEGA